MSIVPRPEKALLGGGMTLHVIPTTRFKTARLTLHTVMRADADLSPRMTLLFNILNRGTEQYPSVRSINRRLDELYGTALSIRNLHLGDAHILSFTATLLENEFLPAADRDMDILGGVLEVLSQLILHPLTDPDGVLRRTVVESEKQDLANDIRDERNIPDTYADTRFFACMYPDEPCGVSLSGDPAQVMGFTAEELTETYRAWVSSAHFEVFYVGRTPRETVADKWRTAFGGWAPEAASLPTTVMHIPPLVPRRRDEEKALSQGRLCMSWTCDIKVADEPAAAGAAVLFCELLGEMQGSLLFRRVREELGLCYDCDAEYDPDKGVLSVFCGVRPENRAAAEAAINDCIRRVAVGDITEGDIEAARTSYRSSLRQVTDSPAAMERYWFVRLLSGRARDRLDPEAWNRAVLEADRAAVMSAARRFVPDTVYWLGAVPGTETTLPDTPAGEEL